MKLVQKTALYLLLVAIPVAVGSVFLLHGYIHREVVHEIDEVLLSDLRQIEYQLRQQPPKALILLGWDPNISVARAKPPVQMGLFYKDTVSVDYQEKKQIPLRILQSTVYIGNQPYRITIRQSYLEFDELARILSFVVIGCFLVVIGVLVLAEVLISRRIWQPFFAVIHQLQQYRIDAPNEVAFPISDVEEFKLLSQSLDVMSQRARQQYTQQKQFTDNASHEMQTPLSILSFELELLQQSERLNEVELDRIQRSLQVVKRLSSLNRSLLLLAKIDNHQFGQLEPVIISALVSQLLDDYQDYSIHRGIFITRIITGSPVRYLNRQLAEILFSNLLNNAVRHGEANSLILVQVSSDTFIVTNEGDPLPFPREDLFHRFVRNQSLPQSTGLGLALVKEIADQYSIDVSYHYISNQRRHLFEIRF